MFIKHHYQKSAQNVLDYRLLITSTTLSQPISTHIADHTIKMRHSMKLVNRDHPIEQ